MPRAVLGQREQLLFAVPVERFAALFGFVAALVEALEQVDLFVRHEVQAIAAEEPQQVARYQVGDLRIAVEDLGNQVLAEVLGAFRVARQFVHQFVETLEEQPVVFFRHLFGLAQGAEDVAQVLEPRGKQTLVFYMGLGNLAEIAARLVDSLVN